MAQGLRDARRLAVVVASAAALFALAGPSASSAAPTVIGQWRFDEPSGHVALDDGPFALDGQLGTSAATDATDPERVAGVASGALRFGGGGLVRLPQASELEPQTLTVEAVVRGDGSPGEFRYVVAHGAVECIAGSYGLYTGRAGGISFYVFDGKRYMISAGAAPKDVWDGRWHHVAGVFDGSTLRLYVDGRPVGSPQPAPLTIAYRLTSDDTYFGMYRGSCALSLRGDVDLIRMWTGALGPDTVASLSDQALTPSPEPAPADPPLPTAPPASIDPPNAPSTRPPLRPATAGTSMPAPAPPAAAPPSAPGAPPRACLVRSSAKQLRVGRVSVITVTVSLRRKPLGRARVVATHQGTHRVLARASTARNGLVRLRLRPTRRGIVRVGVSSRRGCSAAALTVVGR